MELKMLTKFFGILRPVALSKVGLVDSMSETESLRLREAGFEALACLILDAFGSLDNLREISVILGEPQAQFTCAKSETSPGSMDLVLAIDRPVRIETVGAEIPEWANAPKLLEEMLPLSKIGAGTLTVGYSDHPVQLFRELVVRNTEDPTLADYRMAVQALAALANDAFGHIRVINELKG